MDKEQKEIEKLKRAKADARRIDEGKLRSWVESTFGIWVSKGADDLYFLANFPKSENDLYQPWGVALLAPFKSEEWGEVPANLFRRGVMFADMFGYTTPNEIKNLRFFIFCWLSSGIYRWTYQGQRENLLLIPSEDKLTYSVELPPHRMELVGQINTEQAEVGNGKLAKTEVGSGADQDTGENRPQNQDGEGYTSRPMAQGDSSSNHMERGI